jgi:hypothetical protein
MKNRKHIVTSAEQNEISRISARIVRQTLASITTIEPSVSISIGGKDIKENLGNPYGILPFAMSASREELVAVAQALEASKYLKTERGDYYGAWRDSHRQRIIEGVLTGMVNFNLTTLQ